MEHQKKQKENNNFEYEEFYVLDYAYDCFGQCYLEQLSMGLKTYNDALKFKNNEFTKKNNPNCWIVRHVKSK